MSNALADRTDHLAIPVRNGPYVSRLLVRDDHCAGAAGFDLDSGAQIAILARAVLLAAGGHTRIWRQSTSRRG